MFHPFPYRKKVHNPTQAVTHSSTLLKDERGGNNKGNWAGKPASLLRCGELFSPVQ